MREWPRASVRFQPYRYPNERIGYPNQKKKMPQSNHCALSPKPHESWEFRCGNVDGLSTVVKSLSSKSANGRRAFAQVSCSGFSRHRSSNTPR